MAQTKLEKQLTFKNRMRRLILGGIAIVGVILSIVAGIQLNAHPTDLFIYLISIGIVASFYSCAQLIVDCIACGYRVVARNGQHITVYRGFLHRRVYVDGVENAQLGPFAIQAVVDVWLNSQVRVTVSFTRNIWYMAHLSFSDLSSSIEV